MMNIRKQIKDARFENEKEFNGIVRLPKIKITFDNRSLKTGKIFIRSSIQYDQRLEKLRLDSALQNFIVERQYLSDDRNWYVYEFISGKSFIQETLNTQSKFIVWAHQNIADHHIRLDTRTVLPIHMLAVSGQTGSGKTMFLLSLCNQVLSKNSSHELFVIDSKRADLY